MKLHEILHETVSHTSLSPNLPEVKSELLLKGRINLRSEASPAIHSLLSRNQRSSLVKGSIFKYKFSD